MLTMRTLQIPAYIQRFWNAKPTQDLINQTNKAYSQLRKTKDIPDVSVVIPAYNEEKSIVQTLASICNNQTQYAVEVVVVNNNSKDNTANLVTACGVNCVLETKQGITAARNTGLAAAKGQYVINADADTIYPEKWIELMIQPLVNGNCGLTYGTFSFIPEGKTARFTYFLYEYFADIARWLNKTFKDEAVNVYGFNSAYKRENGIAVNGYEHPPGTNEDGWLALKLRNKGFGKLHFVNKSAAHVWTSDRRIEIDGGLVKATITRLKRLIFRQSVQRNDL